MKYLRWLSIGAAFALCLCIALPMNVHAASNTANTRERTSASKAKAAKHKSQAASRATSASKSGKALRSGTAAKSVKSAKAGKSGKARHAASRKGRNAARNVATVADTADRDLWLKRAQSGELLSGKASWYGPDFHNKATASGLSYDMYTFTAAHRTLPMGTVVKVTDQDNGKSVMVCVTDRGPFVRGRIIDLSWAAAKQLDLGKRGVGRVDLEVVSDESGTPLKADQAYFVRYGSHGGDSKVGPFRAFADAAAMHEALRQAHPEAEVVLDSAR